MARKPKPDTNDQAIEQLIAAAQPAPEPEPEPEVPADPAAKEELPPDVAIFVSFEREPQEFEIIDLRPERTEGRRLLWRVPLDQAERFASHHHVVTGRVRRVS